MKFLLRSALLLFISLSLEKSVLAQPASSPSTISPTLLGTWSSDLFSKEAIIVFDKTGTVNLLSKKTYGNYEYYQFPDAEEYGMMQQIANGKLVIESSPKYKLQDNLVEIAIPNGSVDQLRLDFTNNGQTVNFTEKIKLSRVFLYSVLATIQSYPTGLNHWLL